MTAPSDSRPSYQVLHHAELTARRASLFLDQAGLLVRARLTWPGDAPEARTVREQLEDLDAMLECQQRCHQALRTVDWWEALSHARDAWAYAGSFDGLDGALLEAATSLLVEQLERGQAIHAAVTA